MTAWRKRAATAVLLLLAASALRPESAWAEISFQADAGETYDDNLSRAISRTDIVGDSALDLGLSIGRRAAPDDRSAFTLSADLRGTQYSRFHGLDEVALGAGAELRRKFGLGPYAPWASMSGSLASEAYAQSIRNGRRATLALDGGRRMSQRLELSVALGLERFDAERVENPIPGVSGDAFSVRAHSLSGRAEYEASARWLLIAGLRYRNGDVVASTRRNLAIFEYSSAVLPDPAFGPDYVAYRLGGRTWTASAAASWAAGPHASLNFGITRALTRATGGFNYGSTQVNANLFWSY